MKKEQIFDAVGEINDDILDRYHQMDQRLARKHSQKRMTLRVLAVAASLTVLLCACLPLGMLVHPVSRAVLQGDSEALTEQLVKTPGFALWQDQTAQKLEQVLPAPMWEFMQSTPIINVLTQSQFSGMKAQDTFVEDVPYHLYFVSGGDGTCTLEYVTTDPAFTGSFVLEIPEKSPAGDIVTAIDIDQFNRKSQEIDHFPYVLTATAMESLCNIAKENEIEDFEYGKLRAYYLKLSLKDLAPEGAEELLEVFPIVALGDVYVFDSGAEESERDAIYGYLTTYCEWDEAKYQQSVNEIVKLAKQSGSRELAELCLTVLRNSDLHQVSGITIPKTVTSINQVMWAQLSGLETVTVAKDHPNLKMIDGCLVDTATGTLKLYLREDGEFPENTNVQTLDSYAFALCDLSPTEQGEVSLRIPEGITEINRYCFDGLSMGEALGAHIYLPQSLSFFGGETQYDYMHELFYHYPGTLEEWESGITFGKMDKRDYVYLFTADADQLIRFYYHK